MKRQWMVFVAAMTAFGITACGSGDGIVINGTSAGEAESTQLEDGSETGEETTSGTTIEILTGETTPAVESAAESTEGQTQAPAETEVQIQPAATTQAPTQTQTQAQTQASTQPETTAAKVYKVTDVKKTMYATASVRVRSSYSTSASVLAGLSKDEKIEVTGESENGWFRVNYNGNTGYVSKDYLTETAPQTQTGQSSSGTGTSGSQTSGTGSGTASGQTGPTTSGTSSGTSSGTATGPTSGNTGTASNNGVGPGGTTSPGQTPSQQGTTSPGGTESSGTGTSSGTSTGGNSVTGSVTSLDPSGVTIQTSNGTTYQFIWGSNVPALAPGEKIQIFYETTSSGEKRVTSYSK